MCRNKTEEREIVLCSRCGNEANPTDGWEHGWPIYGKITLGFSSVIQWQLLRRVQGDSSNNETDISKAVCQSKHPAIKNFGYQEIKLTWGEYEDYRLCRKCQIELLEIVGEFFFKNIPK